MENNLENKAKFFAQYWGQEVLEDEEADILYKVCVIDLLNARIGSNKCYLRLKPLSKISDEDALFGSSLLKGSSHLSNESRIYQFKQLFESPNFWVNQTNIPLNNMLVCFDFLRSKSYALPYMGLSVEEQVERGWVRLIE